MKTTYCEILKLDEKTCTPRSIERACVRLMKDTCEAFISNPPSASELEKRLQSFEQVAEIYHYLHPSESFKNTNKSDRQTLGLNETFCSSQAKQNAYLNRITTICKELMDNPSPSALLKKGLEKIIPVMRAYKNLCTPSNGINTPIATQRLEDTKSVGNR
ncbi:MAG: hypothetical protein ACOY3I_07980 [Verrucomicrobiota bacterium]